MPAPHDNSIGRINRNQDGHNATGFILNRGGEDYIVTAYHAVSRALSREKPIFHLFREGRGIVSAAAPLSKEGRSASAEDASRDLVIAKVFFKSSAAKSLMLSPTPPQVGQPVWLFHIPFDSRIAGMELLTANPPPSALARAVVTRSSNRRLEYRFEGGGPEKTWTSGSPVLDEKGEVVGINVYGFGRCRNTSGGAAIQVSGDCDVWGVAVPHESLLRMLAPALK